MRANRRACELLTPLIFLVVRSLPESVNDPGDQLMLQRFDAYQVVAFPVQVVFPPPTC